MVIAIDRYKPNSDPKVGPCQASIRAINVCIYVLYVCMAFVHGYILDNQSFTLLLYTINTVIKSGLFAEKPSKSGILEENSHHFRIDRMTNKEDYSINNIVALDATEHIRKRPGMYLGGTGSKGIINLIKGLFLDITYQLGSDNLFFHFSVLNENTFQIIVKAHDAIPDSIIKSTDSGFHLEGHFHFVTLKALSKHLKIEKRERHTLEVHWSLDLTIFPRTEIDFINLNEVMTQMAYLHRKAEILITDKSTKYHNQGYFSFPNGIEYIYDRCTAEALGTPQFELRYDGKIGNNTYQAFLGYRTDWYPPSQIISYANEMHTICNGSLVEGILEGLILGCRHYARKNTKTTYKIRKKKFSNGLILVCAVRGKGFIYKGSFKESLYDEQVKKDIKKIIKQKTIDFILEHPEKANKFLWRFDEGQLTSGLM